MSNDYELQELNGLLIIVSIIGILLILHIRMNR